MARSPQRMRPALLALLLFAVSLAFGAIGSRLFNDRWMLTFGAIFGVSTGVQAYVFYYDGRYHIRNRMHRAVLTVVLLTVGFGLAWLLFPQSGSILPWTVMTLFFSLLPMIELILGRPIFRRTPR